MMEQLWSDKRIEVTAHKQAFITIGPQKNATVCMTWMRDEYEAELKRLRNRVDTLERALSVSDEHVAEIILANEQ